MLSTAAACAHERGDRDAMYAFAVRATRTGEAHFTIWGFRLGRELGLRQYEAAVATIEAVANGNAAALAEFKSTVLWNLDRALTEAKQPALRRRMLKVLAESYAPKREVGDADGFRVNYARLLVAEGAVEPARALLPGIKNPWFLRDIMVDPVLRTGLPTGFDLRAATEQRLTAELAYIAANPDKLEPYMTATALQRQLGRPGDAVALLESVRAKLDGNTFSDIAANRAWWWDSLARSQLMLGRRDDGLRSLRIGATATVDGTVDVSLLINLMDALVQHGRAQDALNAEQTIGLGPVSDFGAMQFRRARACAYAALGRDAEAATDLAYLKARQTEDPDALGDVLACTGDMAGAAANLIDRLGDPALRNVVLLRASKYAPGSDTVKPGLADRNFDLLIARTDVRAALLKAGPPITFNVSKEID
ncbi:MAG: hypothetical protein V4659_01065 [Pseudomonadota bacterium]